MVVFVAISIPGLRLAIATIFRVTLNALSILASGEAKKSAFEVSRIKKNKKTGGLFGKGPSQ